MTTQSASRGLCSSRMKRPFWGLNSNSLCSVLASRPVASFMRMAALPVGAAKAVFNAAWSARLKIAPITVVFPVPGPPVKTAMDDDTMLCSAAL
ncbi:MAG: hypothetical protein BWX66_01619 [Deltaproteobacteria bacterium ADurb.Bin058]|nr:MAG: hypothetical protein BWX66_01619 [Deltaproteobacteria bacterium ADurb.Bin058]